MHLVTHGVPSYLGLKHVKAALPAFGSWAFRQQRTHTVLGLRKNAKSMERDRPTMRLVKMSLDLSVGRLCMLLLLTAPRASLAGNTGIHVSQHWAESCRWTPEGESVGVHNDNVIARGRRAQEALDQDVKHKRSEPRCLGTCARLSQIQTSPHPRHLRHQEQPRCPSR